MGPVAVSPHLKVSESGWKILSLKSGGHRPKESKGERLWLLSWGGRREEERGRGRRDRQNHCPYPGYTPTQSGEGTHFPGLIIQGLSHLKSCRTRPPGEWALGQHHRARVEDQAPSRVSNWKKTRCSEQRASGGPSWASEDLMQVPPTGLWRSLLPRQREPFMTAQRSGAILAPYLPSPRLNLPHWVSKLREGESFQQGKKEGPGYPLPQEAHSWYCWAWREV